jgi:hypothetical protein
MATERVILCGGAPEGALPVPDPHPLRLRMWGPHRNVHFAFEDMRKGLWGDVPSPFLDLIDVAVYVYCADQAVRRGADTDRNFGEDWRRRLFFRIPVRDPALWNHAETKQALVAALSFLTEDVYDFRFNPLRQAEPIQSYFRFTDEGWRGPAEEVVLYSGGLDSLGGAIEEAVIRRRQVVLVQHRPSLKGAPRQRDLLRLLRHKAGGKPPILLPVTINKDKGLSEEPMQRSRSFLYASLGAALAAMLGLARVRFYENGVASLNLPPSAQVVGAPRAPPTPRPSGAWRACSPGWQTAPSASRIRSYGGPSPRWSSTSPGPGAAT